MIVTRGLGSPSLVTHGYGGRGLVRRIARLLLHVLLRRPELALRWPWRR